MALIKCPECGREVSSVASACPGCGFPLADKRRGGTVVIRMTNFIGTRGLNLFFSRNYVWDENGMELWSGWHGETASFGVSGPTRIQIHAGDGVSRINATVYPGRRYHLEKDFQNQWKHLKQAFRLVDDGELR